MGGDASPGAKGNVRRKSLVNLSPTTQPGGMANDVQKAAGRTRKMSLSLTQENLDVAANLQTKTSTIHEADDGHDSDHDSF